MTPHSPLWGRDSVKEQWGEACLFRAEGDVGLNSPTVQSGAGVAQDRLRANSRMGRRGWQCLSPRKALTS